MEQMQEVERHQEVSIVSDVLLYPELAMNEAQRDD